MKFLTIPFSQAWAHVAHSPAYWIFIVLALIVASLIIFFFLKQNNSGSGVTTGGIILFGVAIAIVLTAIIYRPGEVAANTSPSEAARGIFIGY